MVEFGLKLEDNKVADWTEHYIDYEKLKHILKKCQAADKRWSDLAAKKPLTTASITDSFYSGVPTPVPTPYASRNTSKEDLQGYERQQLQLQLQQQQKAASTAASGSTGSWVAPVKQPQLDRIKEERSRSGDLAEGDYAKKSSTLSEVEGEDDVDAENENDAETETTELVPARAPQQDYGSAKGSAAAADGGGAPATSDSTTDLMEIDNSSQQSDSSTNLIRFALERADSAFGVTDYFSKSFERQVRDTLKELENYSQEFDECLVNSLSRVNTFYNSRLQELEVQLLVLKENVASSRSPTTKENAFSSQSPTTSSSKAATPPSDVEEDTEQADELETPLVQNRKKSQRHRKGKRSMDFVHEVAFKVAQVGGRISGKGMQKSESNEGLYDDDNTQDEKQDKALLSRKIKEAESIQRALVDQYRTAKLLHNFAIMNYTGFVKIVKKHDKSLPRKKGRYKQAIKPVNICNEGNAVEALASRMEHLYANWFCDRDVSEARAQMFPKKGDGLEMDWSQLRFGYRLGMCSVLGLWVCWDCVWGLLSSGKSTIGGRTAFPVFRATGGLLLLQWFWGCSVWVWTRYRINYIYLFDFNPQIVESPLAIFNRAVDNTLFFLINMLLYYKAGAHDVPGHFPAGVFPFFLVLYTCYQLIFPLRIRVPMWQSIWEVVTAPMIAPSFFHGYVGDIFTSMVKVFQDMLWTICFIFSGDWMISEDTELSTAHQWSRTNTYAHVLIPLLTLLPLWFRFNQCLRRYADTGNRFPHLANAFKYALSQTVTLFGAFHPLYLGMKKQHTGVDLFQFFWGSVFISSSLYSFAWDVYMDWGLGRPKFGFLGPSLMFPKKYGYFVIIGLDLVLRFAWVLTLVPPQSGASFALPQYMTAVSLMLELFRRTIWGFLRLENEHRSNASGFRRVGFVPLHFSTGHMHEYKKEKEHRGVSVLLEVAVVTIVVLGACTVSVVMAQQATERLTNNHLDL
jgi:hypothetical protein